MRYGRTLEASKYGPWKANYIDYAKLKKLLRDDDSAPTSPTTATTNDTWTDADESRFVDELVNVQLEKVHNFHKSTYERLRERTSKCEAQLDSIAAAADTSTSTNSASNSSSSSTGKKPVPSDAEQKKILRDVLAELDNITRETNELEKYSRINYAGFLKAAKKHDRKRGGAYRIRPLLQVRLAALPFNKEDYGPLLFRLSAMYSFARQQDKTSEGESDHHHHHSSKEEYVSHKFWVHPENLLEVKTIILRRLPVLVYNPQTSKTAEGNQPDPSITSIYFDNPAFELYSNKVENSAGSSLRLRWYGSLNARPTIFVEKKTVDEENTSREARFTTKDKYIQRFINDDYGMEKQIQKLSDRAGPDSPETQTMIASVEEIRSFIKEHDLQPVVRANYTRTAFQIPGDDRVRISLDTDLAFIREDAIDSDRPCRDPDSWHRTDIDNNELEYPFTSIRKGEITRFPFAVLEIKMRTASPGKKSAEWIEDLMSSHLVKEAPRFSKFVHGVAQLFEDYVNTFPFWLSQMEVDIRRDPQQAFEEEVAKRQKEHEDETAVGSLLRKGSLSTSRTSNGKKVISPVGSPSVLGGEGASFRRSSAQVSSQQTEDVVEEPDDDETGQQAHTTGTNGSAAPSGLRKLFPTFSTSKYAASRRKRALPPGVVEPKAWIKDAGPVRVEGKVWLANQRTFIKWQHVSVLLASLSLGLFNAAGPENRVGKVLGIVYTLIALFAGGWGYWTYMWRMSLIQGRSGRDFDAVWGPCVVCIGLIVALILNFGFKYQAILREREEERMMMMGVLQQGVGSY